ncbi:MAG: hypothetical protein PHO71_14515 [Bacteroides sp.]|nr:hypothetical protein [Bacteroides sp.]
MTQKGFTITFEKTLWAEDDTEEEAINTALDQINDCDEYFDEHNILTIRPSP